MPKRPGKLGAISHSATLPHTKPPRQPIKNLELDEEILADAEIDDSDIKQELGQ